MSFFDKIKAKLNKKTPKVARTAEKKQEGGEVHILPVPGADVSTHWWPVCMRVPRTVSDSEP
jgi:hypothetical protein